MVNSIVEAVFETAETNPEKFCLADDVSSVTYKEYADLIRRDAEAFRRLGVRSGDHVVIEADQTIAYLATELALHLIGAVFVPVEHNCTPSKTADFAREVDAACVISLKKEVPGVRNFIFMNEFEEMAGQMEPDAGPGTFPEKDAVSEILFSTGTTGKEKGIVLTFDNDVALAENVIYGASLKPDNVELILSPFNHSHGLRRYYANMYAGASVVMQGSVMDMKTLFGNLEKWHVTAMDLVPAALSVVLRLSKDKLGDYCEQFRYIQFGSAPIKKEDEEHLKRLLPGVPIYNMYGSTESGISCIYNVNLPDRKSGCIGKAARNAEMLIVDEDGNEIHSDASHTGSLACRGRINMKGYWNDPEETEKVLKNGLVVASDIAYIDSDGEVILLGRAGDVISVGGKKVSPLEVETAAAKIEGISDCGCVGAPDEMRGEVPVLFVKMKGGAAFDPAAIRSELQKVLEPYKVPARILKTAKIPRTYKGSMQRGKLKEMLERAE